MLSDLHVVGAVLELLGVGGGGGEQVALQLLDGVVELLDGLEVAVDDDVEQAVDEGRGAQAQEPAVVVPPAHDGLHVESADPPDRNEATGEDEARHAAELVVLVVRGGGEAGQRGVGDEVLVAVLLGGLGPLDGRAHV